MESQTLINGAIAFVGFLGGWILNRIMKSLDTMDSEIKQIPDRYVRKDDYHRDISEIKAMLKSIFDKIDGKADK